MPIPDFPIVAKRPETVDVAAFMVEMDLPPSYSIAMQNSLINSHKELNLLVAEHNLKRRQHDMA